MPRPQRLLIADDSAAMRTLVREAIGHRFSEILEAADGRDLLWTLMRSEVASHEYPLVVSDLCMPGYDGLDVLEAWRDLYPTHPTVLITAFPSQAIRERAAQLDIVLLAKPFSTSALRRVIAEVSDGDVG